MATPNFLDFVTLLAPIPGANPCGTYLRLDPVYEQIKAARREGDRDVLGGEGETANWPQVIELAQEALASRTKDLMIAAWLTEALTAAHGFAGVRDGLLLVRQLLENYWEGLYPLVDDGDLEPRVAPLNWLTDVDRGARLPNRLRDVPLTPDAAAGCSWNYWKARYAPPKAESEDEAAYAERKAAADEKAKRFEEAVAAVDLDFIVRIHEDVQQARAALADLDRVATERCGGQAPGVTAFRTALEECEALIRRIHRERGGAVTAESPADGGAAEPAPAAGAGAATSGPIRSREDAFRRLAEVSAYLRRTEPQSPVPLLIDRAMAWGQMPFDQLLREMIKDESSRVQVSDLLGIKPRTEGAG